MHLMRTLSSVRVRLTLWNVAVLASALLIFGGAVRYTLQMSLRANTDRHLEHQVSRIQQIIRLPSPHSPILVPHPFSPAVLDLEGHPLAFFSVRTAWDRNTFLLSAQGRENFSIIRDGSQTLRVLSVPLKENGNVIGVIQAVTPITLNLQQVALITRVLLTLIPLALLAAGIGGAFLTGRALRPVREISQAAGRIEASNLSGRLPVTGEDELSELAATFNAMLGRLEDAFLRLTEANERQRRFTADASHELRTPLTVIKANTSLALMIPRSAGEYRQALEAVDRSADRTEKIVRDLLLLARVDAGQLALRQVPVSLRAVLQAAQDSSVPPAAAPVILEVADTLEVTGDADALTRLFGNLLFNAVQHTPPTGRIIATATTDETQITVSIADTGEGIPATHLPHLGERFYRVDAARSGDRGGTGLGLAICRGIAEAHGGHLVIASSFGQGTTVTVTLPRSRALTTDQRSSAASSPPPVAMPKVSQAT
jgi:heavy metal sensor kinase